MRNEKICIFTTEEDCSKLAVNLTCEDCEKYKHYETIEKAMNDFVSLGESFNDLFALCNTLLKNNGTLVKLEVPVESIQKIKRVMTSFLTSKEELSREEIMYRRLTFYFFGIVVDEFSENEYTDSYLQ